MGLKEDVLDIKNEISEVKEQSFALELIKDYKKQNKRQFIIILILLVMWFCTIGYLVYILNDIESIETTQQIDGAETIENSNITNGDMYGENKTN